MMRMRMSEGKESSDMRAEGCCRIDEALFQGGPLIRDFSLSLRCAAHKRSQILSLTGKYAQRCAHIVSW